MQKTTWIALGFTLILGTTGVLGALTAPVARATAVTDADAERFVATWLPRFEDAEWMATYLNSSLTVDDGFGALPDEDKRALVTRLLDAYEATNATFRAMINPEDAPENETLDRRGIASEILYGIVFDKTEFMQRLVGDDAGPDAEPAERGTSEYFPNMTLEEISAAMEAENNETLVLDDLGDVIAALDLTGSEDVRGVLADVKSIDAFDVSTPIDMPTALANAGFEAPGLTAVDVPEVAPVALGSVVDLAHRVVPEAAGAIPERLLAPTKVLPPIPAEILGVLNTAVAAATYTVCWQGATDAEPTCAALPGVVQTPTPVDVDGDLVPDVVVTVSATVGLADVPDPGVSLDVRRIDAANLAAPLPVLVFVVYKIPATTDVYAVAGVDGREFTLPQATTVTVSVSDVLSDDPGVHVRLAAGVAGDAAAILGGVAKGRVDAAGGIELYDPTLASLRLAPVPPVLEAHLTQADATRLLGAVTERGREVDVALSATVPTRATLTILQETEQAGGAVAARIMAVDVNQLPTDVSVEAKVFPSDSTVTYAASAPIARIEYLSATVPDVADPSTFTLEALATVEDLPDAVMAVVGGGEIHYEASADVARVTFASGEVEGGTLTSLTYAEAADIPERLDVTVGDDRTDIVASEPLGTIRYLAFEGSGTPVGLAGDHFASLTHRLPGGGTFTSTSAQITGFKEAHVSVVDGRTTASLTLAGGQPFFVYTEDLDASGLGTTTAGYVSNLPRETTVTLEGATLDYEASDVINRVALQMETTTATGRTLVYGQVDGVPQAFTFTMDAPNDQISYEASSAVPRVVVAIEKESSGKRSLLVGEINDIPRSVRIAFDPAAGSFGFQTDSRLGRILVQTLEEGAGGTRLAYAEVKDLPTTLLVKASASGDIGLDTDSFIGEITVATSNFNGFYTIPGDGVLLYRKGGVESVYARITGLSGFHAAVTQRFFSLDLDHPTPFTVQAVSDDSAAYVAVSALPEHMEVSFEGANIYYRASRPIASILVYFEDAAQTAALRLTDVPAQVLVEMGANPRIDLGPGLGRLDFFYERGRRAVGICCGDYVALVQDASGALAVSGRLTGIRSFASDLGGKRLSLDFSHNLPFVAYASTPTVQAYVSLSNVPGRITIDAQASSFAYSATNAINRVEAYVKAGANEAYARIVPVPRLVTATWSDNSVSLHTASRIQNIYVAGGNAQGTVSVDVRDLPSTMTATWNIGSGAGSIVYDADGTIGSVTVQAARGKQAAFLQVTGVPAHLAVRWGEKSASLETSSPIGSIWVMATNDGRFSSLGGDHALYYNVDGVTRASFRLSGISGFSFAGSGAYTTVNLRLVGGQTFSVYVNDNRNGRRTYVDGWFGPLPSSTTITVGPVTTVQVDRNMDLALYAEAGPVGTLAGVSAPYWTHGLVGRADSSASAVKATLFLTGLPTYMRLDPQGKRFTVDNFAPRYGYIHADFQKPGLSVEAYLGSPANDYDFRLVQGDKSMSAYMVANRHMGNMWARLKTSDHAIYASVSNVPSSMAFSYSVPAGAEMRASYAGSRTIGSIFVGYYRPWSSVYQAYASIEDIPTYMSMRLYKHSKGAEVYYDASGNTLDITLYVDPSLFSGALSARAYVQIRDIGGYTRIYVDSWTGDYRLYSSPRIGMIYVDVSASYSYSYGTSGSGGSWWFGYSYHFYIRAYAALNHLILYVEGLRDVTIRPQLPVLDFRWFDADYFVFGWKDLYVDLGIDIGVSLSILGWTFLSVHFHWSPRLWVWVDFTTYADHWFRIASICDWWGNCAYADARPHPHYAFRNSFALWNSEDGHNRRRFVFINPWGVIPWYAELGYMMIKHGGIRFGCC